MSRADFNLTIINDLVDHIPGILKFCLQRFIALRATHYCNGICTLNIIFSIDKSIDKSVAKSYNF